MAAVSSQHVAGSVSNSGLQISLPKLQLQTFDGNLQQWQEFWDIFNASVHQQQNLPSVANFSCLKSSKLPMQLCPVPFNNENYDVALQLLKEKF